MPSMTTNGQTRKEAFDLTESLSSPRHQLRLGIWNTRTLYETGKIAQVIKEMNRYRISILGVSEVRWTGAGKYNAPNGELMLYSGREDGQHREGVGLILDKKTKQTLMEWEPINQRIIRARFFSKFSKLTIIQCYAPTNEALDEDKDDFYECLQDQINKAPKHDTLLIMGDMNAKVGTENSGYEKNIGKNGMGTRNENGERFLNLCMENSMVIGGTIFKHKEIHKATWTSPDMKTHNQIDHIAINNRWRTSLLDVKAIRGADINSDHTLVLGRLRLKLKTNKKRNAIQLFDSNKLRVPPIKEAFSIELSNKFHALSNIQSDDLDLDEYCTTVTETFTDVSKVVLGYKERKRKPWISDDTWKLIEERKLIKQEMLACDSKALPPAYKHKCKEVKKSAKRDKKIFIERRATDAEQAASKGDSRTLYKITRELAGNATKQTSVVKDVNGNVLCREEDQCQRWTEHFKNVLNRPEPINKATINLNHKARELEMAKNKISCREIEDAIQETKSNRAPGADKVTSDMLKADKNLSAKCLVELFNRVWKEERVPEAWKEGIIIKLPKKGDLTDCNNWRGINLLSVPGKIFCRVLLKRIRTSVEKSLREEQAGFRAGRSCTDQIFVLRTIIEQSREWNSSLLINFIDFEKAFDSVHHNTLWEILELYGFPNKIINILKNMYSGNRCCVRHDGQQNEWFQIKSGVRQGCVISPLLFLVVIDWVMKEATSDKPRGITWNLFEHLEDIDFADDIALISHTHKDMQEKTNRVSETAASVGLKISHKKSKVLKVNPKTDNNIKVNDKDLEVINEFKYLGSYLTSDGNIDKEIKTRIANASAAFQRLRNIWNSRQYSTHTKLRLYTSNVRSILLYAAETWKTNKAIESKLRGFEGRCLRRILRIRWEERITNREVEIMTGIRNITDEIKRRRWSWLGHILRMKNRRHQKMVHSWNPQGKRKRGRPVGTWRRTVLTEGSEAGKTWNELRWMAQDRHKWRDFVGALCSSSESGT